MKQIHAQEIQTDFNIAIIVSRFNEGITTGLYKGAIDRLAEFAVLPEQISVVWVPGAIEIPVTAQRLAMSENFDAIICLGAVIQGETKHFDYVCDYVTQGCLALSMQFEMPVVFGILTTKNEEQALERIGGVHGHKGREAVDTALEMISVLEQIDEEYFEEMPLEEHSCEHC